MANETLKRHRHRTQAVAQLEADIEVAKLPIEIFQLTDPHQRMQYKKTLGERLAILELAILKAQQAAIPATQAKKLLSEMQAQVAAVETAEQLQDLMEDQTAGTFSLRVS